jgi:hypothetical protein
VTESKVTYREVGPPLEATDFDEWWNRILSAVLAGLIQRDGPMGDDLRNRDAFATEVWLRDLFRQELLTSDWNHLEQCIHACTLPFDGWISTNYTHFADRAIHSARSRSDSGDHGQSPSWLVAASGSEATRLLSDLMHSPALPLRWGPVAGSAARKSPDRTSRVLFKIHGDIARFDTMTLAGLDKEVGSPFYVRLEGLHPLYRAARAYVADRLERKKRAKNARLVLHVVGHALRDSMLNRLLADIVIDAHRAGSAIEWRRADWNGSTASSKVSDALDRGLWPEQRAKIEAIELEEKVARHFVRRKYTTTAARYLASWGRALSIVPEEVSDPNGDQQDTLVSKFVKLDQRDVERR